MSEIKTVTIGDISDAWRVVHHDKDSNEITLDNSYTCHMAVMNAHGDTLVAREVTRKSDDGKAFEIYLTETDTALLKHRHRYTLAVQLVNATLPKPLKKEIDAEFEATRGAIT